jgi:hypothetical protein
MTLPLLGLTMKLGRLENRPSFELGREKEQPNFISVVFPQATFLPLSSSLLN